MKIEQIKTISGPNVFSHNPVLVMRLDLEDLAFRESYEVPGFIDRLLEALPGVRDHYCGLGRPGGFVERLRGGTYFGHIVEHVALELTDAVSISVNRGKTIDAGRPGVYNVGVEFRSEPAMQCLLETAVEFVDTLVHGRSFDLESRIAKARALVGKDALGPSTQTILEAASARNIPWRRLDEESLIQLGYGKQRRFIRAAMTSMTSAIAVDVASDKHLTKTLLSDADLPVPRGKIVETVEQAIEAAAEMAGTAVIKPLDANQGKGVTVGIRTPEQAAEAYRNASAYSRRVIVEECYEGNDYRVLTVNGKIVAAARRDPARMVGDGVHTIAELIEQENRNPLRSDNHGSALSKIVVDAIVVGTLRKQDLDLSSVPAPGRTIPLRRNANLSTGGSAVDVTDDVHPDFRLICERASRVAGLDICGIDLITPDISQPWKTGGIVELNAAPGLRMHAHPSEGKPRDVGAAIVESIYPHGQDGRIPIASVTGTNGKTTVVRLVARMMTQAGRCVGMTSTDGIWVDGQRIVDGDTSGPRSARTILADPSVDCAVLETARGGIVRNGLGYDWSDVGVITNVRADHIGQDGIETVEDIARIKILVAERVRPNGTLILNADDPLVAEMRNGRKVQLHPKKLVWFSLESSTPLLNEHRAAGGTVYFLRDGWLIEAEGIAERRIIEAASAPLSLAGTAPFQIANMLAATAAARALGASLDAVHNTLLGFDNHLNAGRTNLWEVHSGYVLLDYGHNPAAIEAIGSLLRSWGGARTTGVLTVPGDRADTLIEAAAIEIARGFDRIILREDKDLRGREPAEVLSLLRRTIERERPDREIVEFPDESQAAAYAIETMIPGEVITIFCETCHDLDCLLEGFEHTAVAVPDAGYLARLRAHDTENRARIA